MPRSEVDRLARVELAREEVATLRVHQALLTKQHSIPDAVIGTATRNLERDLPLHGEPPCIGQCAYESSNPRSTRSSTHSPARHQLRVTYVRTPRSLVCCHRRRVVSYFGEHGAVPAGQCRSVRGSDAPLYEPPAGTIMGALECR